MSRPALFLDRDGVINIDHGHVHRPDDFDFIPGIFDLVLTAQRCGYATVVVTNQAGIGRGLYTEDQFAELTRWMIARFNDFGAVIDAVYHCPYHPEHGLGAYRQASFDRKPQPGMLLRAAQDLDLDLRNSLLVGDHATDVQAALAAGVEHCFLFRSNDRCERATAVDDLSDVSLHLQALATLQRGSAQP
jgi:D-glycero-D-manno-heptose 1,7-bisphosphate phosphatase